MTRKTWDTEEYAEKARQKDEESKKYAEEAQKALRQGKKPRVRRGPELPKPTEHLKAREKPLELDKNQGQTIIASAAQGPRGPGFYCEVCNRTYKDSNGYLDHLNGRGHLRRLGQTTRVKSSTLEQVRAKIAALREQSKSKTDARSYDFKQRLADIKKAQDAARKERRERKKLLKQQKQDQSNGDTVDNTVMEAMGFGSFGGGQTSK